MKTGMEQYQEWYEILENSGFKRIDERVGNIDYQHPKKKNYIVKFDWKTFRVFHKGTMVYDTLKLELGIIDGIIHAIKWPNTGSDILTNKNHLR